MKRSMLFLVLVFFSNAAFSLGQKTFVYKVVGILKSQPSSDWIQLKTISNSQININCKTAAFDDAIRDQVGGFKTTNNCDDFLKDIIKHANSLTPVDVELDSNLLVKYKVNI